MSQVIKASIKKIVTGGETFKGALQAETPTIHAELFKPLVKDAKLDNAGWNKVYNILTEYVTDAYVASPRKVKGEQLTSKDMRAALAEGKGETNNAIKTTVRQYVYSIRDEVSAQFGIDIDTNKRGTKARAESTKPAKKKGAKGAKGAKGEATKPATFEDVMTWLDAYMASAKPNQVRVDCATLHNRIKGWTHAADAKLAKPATKPAEVTAH
jgi:hypothetical protein